jgi:hypothetical protein
MKNMNKEIELSEEEILYSNNLGKRSYQWELWHSCNNLCKFCYLGHANRHTDKERQIKSLLDLKKSLDCLDFDIYNNVSLIGGEFFQGQLDDADVKKLFMEVIEKLSDLYCAKKIGSIWITATLTIGDQKDLYEVLDVFKEAGVKPVPEWGASGVWICTSWDPKGRFHNEKAKKNWEFHMKNIEKTHPGTKKNTTIILTQPFCEMYLNGQFSPHDFMEEYGTFLFYKQPGLYELEEDNTQELNDLTDCPQGEVFDETFISMKEKLEEDIGFTFYPKREMFRKFLVKYAKEDPDTFDRLFNIKYRADELHRNFNLEYVDHGIVRNKNSNLESDGKADSIINANCRIEPFEKKHIINYATYGDCNECMICDRDQIWDSIYGER